MPYNNLYHSLEHSTDVKMRPKLFKPKLLWRMSFSDSICVDLGQL